MMMHIKMNVNKLPSLFKFLLHADNDVVQHTLYGEAV